MHIDWEPFRQIVKSNRRFVLTSHIRPDADAIGSELGLAALLEERGKNVRIVNPSEVPEHLKFLDPERRVTKIGQGIPAEQVLDTDVHVVLDTSAWNQLQDVTPVFKGTTATKVVIDHHVSADRLDAVEFKDVQAEATGALVVRLAEALGWPIPERAVMPLYCAIATDTGWFRFPSTTGETMRIAGRLIELGAQPHRIYQMLYEQFSPGRVRLAGRVLARLVLECGDRLAYITATQDDFKSTGAKQADTEDLVNECLRIASTECAFIAIEQMNGTIKVSFRSRTELDVSRVAEQFGGGGHRQASGAVLPGPLASAVSKVLEALRAALGAGSA
jgi:phosphoesterase RecJ-like protein